MTRRLMADRGASTMTLKGVGKSDTSVLGVEIGRADTGGQISGFTGIGRRYLLAGDDAASFLPVRPHVDTLTVEGATWLITGVHVRPLGSGVEVDTDGAS